MHLYHTSEDLLVLHNEIEFQLLSDRPILFLSRLQFSKAPLIALIFSSSIAYAKKIDMFFINKVSIHDRLSEGLLFTLASFSVDFDASLRS